MTTSTESKLVLTRSRWRTLALTLLIAIAPVAQAQAQDNDRDPPTRAARVVDVVGDAWLFDNDTREWTRLTRNQTVGEGDRLRTDERARVSLRTGSTTIWVDERSDLELSQLDDGQTLLQIDRGDVALRLRSAENAAETRLRTREGTAQPEREGLYRVEQLDRGSKVYVWQGRMRFEWARGAAPVHLGTGEQVELWWPDGPRAERSALYSDGFGDWVLAESREEGDRPVARYVSPEMTGAEDLDRHGRWETAPEYGAVWVPTTLVVADWAPYRYGRWAWSRHWGWTWVDDAPWGFAPFHYGRWVSWRGRWCWTPGPYVHRPAYAPALVGWIGSGNVSVGVSVGHRPPPPRFGWYPLAPREVYVPAFRHSPRYVHRVNDPRDVRDPVTVQRPHRYRDTPNAVSTLPAPGAAIQPMPVRGPDRKPEPGWNRPLPTAPGRGDLAAVLPAAPTRPAETELPRRAPRPSDGQMGWRSEGQLPVRRDHRGPEAQHPQAPAPAVAQPAVPVIIQQPPPQMRVEQPQRGGDNMPLRAQQQRDAQQRDMQQREAQQREAQQREMQQRDAQHREAQQREMQQRREEMQQREVQQRQQQQLQQQQQQQMQQQQQREAQQREMQQREMQQQAQQREMQQRREEQQRRMPQPEPQRQVEVPRVQMPQPQPQAQPRAQLRDEGPQRGRPEAPSRERRGDQPRQQER